MPNAENNILFERVKAAEIWCYFLRLVLFMADSKIWWMD